jgi:alkanesulfonate monooxygenase SsuD/methylene tetrahydromethanopterin reductase-like flavin-dependent oxidoreductase (luciferase family)
MLRFPALAARFGSERLVIAGVALIGLRSLGATLASDPAMVVLAGVFAGLGFALFVVGGVTYVSQRVPRELAATAQGIFQGVSSSLSQVVAAATGGAIAATVGIAGLFAVGTVLGGVATLIIALAVRPSRSGPGDRGYARARPRRRLPDMANTDPGTNPGTNATRLGILLFPQATDWPSLEAAARRVDELGYEHLWTWDHLYAIVGDPEQPIFEGYATLAAAAKVTRNVRLGLLVGANTFRNPGLVAKTLTTLDHISDGRAIAGLGGAWFDTEHEATGIEFGSGFGQRLDWLEEATDALERLFAGERVTSEAGGRYAFKDLVVLPRPVQPRLPIMIGGSGEKKTLRTVAKHADMWNTGGSVERISHKLEVLRGHCDAVGRNVEDIELTVGCKIVIRDSEAEGRRVWESQMANNRTPMSDVEDDDSWWVGTPRQIADLMLERKAAGFHTFIAEMAAPYDLESFDRWINEVRPMVDGSSS